MNIEAPVHEHADVYPDEIREFVRKYRDRRAQFVENVFKVKVQPWQKEMLDALDAGKTRLAVKSGHGVGKTAFLSWCIVHHLISRFPQKTQVTAPTSGQLFDALAAETKKWLRVLPDPFNQLFNPKSDRIELVAAPESSFAAFRTSRPDVPEALQGVHSSFVLLVADEASAIAEAVFQSAGGSLSGENSIFLLAGNPTRPEGYFYNRFAKPDGRWVLRTVTGYESSLVSQDYIDGVEMDYDGRDNNVFRVRVEGEFPTHDEDKLIKLHLLESAVGRDIVIEPGWPVVWGLDVARGEGDRTALVRRKGRVVTKVETRRFDDTMNIVGWVKDEYRAAQAEANATPMEICVDAIGVGAGVADRLVELNLPALAINVAELASMSQEAYRLRDDLWIQTRDWFTKKDVCIPDHPELLRDLQAPTFEFSSVGMLKVSSKQQMKQRGFKSPDAGDALALTFGGEAAQALFGSDGRVGVGWNADLEEFEPAYV